MGEGDKTTLPIRILSSPKLDPSKEPYRVPKDWNPYQDEFGPAYLYHEEHKCSKFYTDIYLPNWRKWYTKCGVEAPTLIAVEWQAAGTAP